MITHVEGHWQRVDQRRPAAWGGDLQVVGTCIQRDEGGRLSIGHAGNHWRAILQADIRQGAGDGIVKGRQVTQAPGETCPAAGALSSCNQRQQVQRPTIGSTDGNT